jgi:hypothetical protein
MTDYPTAILFDVKWEAVPIKMIWQSESELLISALWHDAIWRLVLLQPSSGDSRMDLYQLTGGAHKVGHTDHETQHLNLSEEHVCTSFAINLLVSDILKIVFCCISCAQAPWIKWHCNQRSKVTTHEAVWGSFFM